MFNCNFISKFNIVNITPIREYYFTNDDTIWNAIFNTFISKFSIIKKPTYNYFKLNENSVTTSEEVDNSCKKFDNILNAFKYCYEIINIIKTNKKKGIPGYKSWWTPNLWKQKDQKTLANNLNVE
jgi:hypothetical protein